MAYTSADLDAIDNAIKKNVKRVRIDDQEVEFNTVDEALKLRRHIARQLGLTKKSALGKRYNFTYKKGV